MVAPIESPFWLRRDRSESSRTTALSVVDPSAMDGVAFQAINNVLSLSLVLAILYVILLVHYELFLSPLSSYPGPLLARITPLHNLYHAFNKDLHLDVAKQHEIYGESTRDLVIVLIPAARTGGSIWSQSSRVLYLPSLIR